MSGEDLRFSATLDETNSKALLDSHLNQLWRQTSVELGRGHWLLLLQLRSACTSIFLASASGSSWTFVFKRKISEEMTLFPDKILFSIFLTENCRIRKFVPQYCILNLMKKKFDYCNIL